MKEIATSDQTPEELFRHLDDRISSGERTESFATGAWRDRHEPEAGEGANELLRRLEAEISLQRARRKAPARNRVLFLVSGVLFIMAGAAAALMILEEMLSGQGREGRGTDQSQSVSGRNF